MNGWMNHPHVFIRRTIMVTGTPVTSRFRNNQTSKRIIPITDKTSENWWSKLKRFFSWFRIRK